eukprot:snap_masked-scaffold_5-processed-gene-8.39-mRNA-1 protein AED:1.00 eAED:1.00 QI:0/-1/0/0/-1/1/1/0/66
MQNLREIFFELRLLKTEMFSYPTAGHDMQLRTNNFQKDAITRYEISFYVAHRPNDEVDSLHTLRRS